MASPRELTLKILLDCEQGLYSNLVLNKHLTDDAYFKDRALVTELVYGVIQNKLRLDYIISKYSRIDIKYLSLSIHNILRMGIYQIVFLDKIPDFAAVNESVSLAKKYGNRGAASFVNAVLRNISRKGGKISYPQKQHNLTQFISIYYSFPLWLVDRWVKMFGPSFTEDLCKSLNERPKTCVRLNTLKKSCNEIKLDLVEEDVKYHQGLYINEALYIDSSPPFKQLKSFKNGLIQMQDESSMLASIAIGAKTKELVLDVAAAPGGKTTHLAQIMKNDGSIISWDIHPHRVKLIEETCKRLGVKIVDAYVKNASEPDERFYSKFDKVLVDAPCSGFALQKAVFH